jgi:hypothetical protein
MSTNIPDRNRRATQRLAAARLLAAIAQLPPSCGSMVPSVWRSRVLDPGDLGEANT